MSRSLPGRRGDAAPSPVLAARRLVPGVALCGAVAAVAWAVRLAQLRLFGHAWLDTFVLAILAGAAVRAAWTPGERWKPGIAFSAKPLLETAVMLLGTQLSAAALRAAGPLLLLGIAVTVAAALGVGYGLGRLLRLPPRLALLVAAGNAICGNSAIAAIAPVIGAKARDVTASIAFTAALGVLVVLLLPLLVPLLGLSQSQYGVLAGLTVYAVPQVLAAAAPVGPLSVQVGTVVKLARVLMLGPLVLALSLGGARRGDDGVAEGTAAGTPGAARPAGQDAKRPAGSALGKLVPWFILGFLALAALRLLGFVPDGAAYGVGVLADALAVLAMAALGLGVDLPALLRAGLPVTLTAALSALLLAAAALGLIGLLRIA